MMGSFHKFQDFLPFVCVCGVLRIRKKFSQGKKQIRKALSMSIDEENVANALIAFNPYTDCNKMRIA